MGVGALRIQVEQHGHTVVLLELPRACDRLARRAQAALVVEVDMRLRGVVVAQDERRAGGRKSEPDQLLWLRGSPAGPGTLIGRHRLHDRNLEHVAAGPYSDARPGARGQVLQAAFAHGHQHARGRGRHHIEGRVRNVEHHGLLHSPTWILIGVLLELGGIRCHQGLRILRGGAGHSGDGARLDPLRHRRRSKGSLRAQAETGARCRLRTSR
mmetsp:Transcript_59141/g.171488  ORF Transcript_59141/g.171488 Transcript_59141/m.171488 type:complete len:212 (+) Transcript_59141:503-1138(+)